jgi:RNA polymerase sigma-70 factor (ECF subfamily)
MSQLQPEIATRNNSSTEFESLVRAIRPELHRYCARMTGSVIDGEDIVQDTLTRAFAALQDGPAIPNLRAWLFRVAHNRAVDYTRDHARRFSDPLEDHPELSEPVSPLDARVMAQTGLRPFVTLPPAQRAAVILKDVLGYSLEEIADVLGRSVAMVKGVLHRGRAALRSVLDDPARGTARLDTPQSELLDRYVRHFGAREFDKLREMLAADASLDVVGVTKEHNAAGTGRYFTNYAKTRGWFPRLGHVEGLPAILMFRKKNEAEPAYFVLVEWASGKIAQIRDFRYVPYILDDCRWSVEG